MLFNPLCALTSPLLVSFLLQDWLTESAKLISKAGHTVEWVTPLGLPIIQPYHRTRTQVVSLVGKHGGSRVNVWGMPL